MDRWVVCWDTGNLRELGMGREVTEGSGPDWAGREAARQRTGVLAYGKWALLMV